MTKREEPIFEHGPIEPAFRVIRKGSNPNGYTMSNGARHLIVKRENPHTVSVRLKVYRKPNSPEVNDEMSLTNEEFLTAMNATDEPVTDAAFAREMGADVGIRGKFARRGNIVNFYYLLDEVLHSVSAEITPSLEMKARRFTHAGAPIKK